MQSHPSALGVSTAPVADAGATQSKYYVLLLLLLAYMLNFVDRQIISILVEPIKQEFSLSDTEIGLMSGFTFALFYAAMGIPLATLADRGKRRNLLVASITIFSAMTALCGLAGSYVQLLLARIGVATGEAGTSPASHSIIADLFPPERLSTAMAVFALGLNLGLALGYLAGGLIGARYGWRVAMISVGAPGLVVALAILTTMREPARQRPARTEEINVSFGDLLSFVAGQRSLCYMLGGVCLLSLVGYALLAWVPAFLMRSHSLSLSTVGIVLAATIGVLGGAGTYFGGRMSDNLARLDTRWTFWLLALAYTGAFPVVLAMLTVSDSTLAIALWCVPALLSGLHMGGTLSSTQRLVRPAMRARMSAILLFLISAFGIGLGPVVVGLLSDALAHAAGARASLGPALMIVSVAYPLAAFLFWRGARTLGADLARAAA